MIGAYEVELISPACDPGAERFSAKAHLEDDIGVILPYLNAAWEAAVYCHEARAITWRMGGRAVAVRPRELSVANLRERDEAVYAIEELIRQIEAVWARRGEIEPSCRRREPPQVLEVYKLLPGGNCRACGEPTCFIFAMKVTTGESDLHQCEPLLDGSHEEQRTTLLALCASAR